nr:hypothetical protein CFP56_03906 [Quercus suber]
MTDPLHTRRILPRRSAHDASHRFTGRSVKKHGSQYSTQGRRAASSASNPTLPESLSAIACQRVPGMTRVAFNLVNCCWPPREARDMRAGGPWNEFRGRRCGPFVSYSDRAAFFARSDPQMPWPPRKQVESRSLISNDPCSGNMIRGLALICQSWAYCRKGTVTQRRHRLPDRIVEHRPCDEPGKGIGGEQELLDGSTANHAWEMMT